MRSRQEVFDAVFEWNRTKNWTNRLAPMAVKQLSDYVWSELRTNEKLEAKKAKENPLSGVRGKIQDILLEVAALYNEVTTSDLQGIAMVKSEEIVKLVNKGE